MSDVSRFIAGVPCWVDAMFPDVAAAQSFYGELFGWSFENVIPEDAGGTYLIASIDGESVAALGPSEPGEPTEWTTYVRVDDADAATERARAAGATILAEPMDVFDAGRMSAFLDPQGAQIRTWQAGTTLGLERVNVHGAVIFNGLDTPDLHAAADFYGAVFGWRVMEGATEQFWALDAYGDHLEARTPGVREQSAAMGVPGFENVVAAVAPSDTAPARWSVTFAVDDVEAIVAAARALGATAPDPVDAPFVRHTTVTDPQGVTFVASQFVPENAPAAMGGA